MNIKELEDALEEVFNAAKKLEEALIPFRTVTRNLGCKSSNESGISDRVKQAKAIIQIFKMASRDT